MAFEDKKISILIADDEETIRKGLSTAIPWQEHGVQVVGVAENGLQAYQKSLELNPDIIITDIQMPQMNGLEFIQKTKVALPNVHFIILSGYDDFAYAQTAIRSGVDAYLLKPVKAEVLLQEVELIKQKILNTLHTAFQNQESLAQAKKGTSILREQVYRRLSNGEYHSLSEINHDIKFSQITPLALPCTSIVFRFSLPDIADKNKFSREDTLLFKEAMRNVLEEISEGEDFIIYEDSQNEVDIVKTYQEDLVAFVEKFIMIMCNISELSFWAGIGSPATSLLEIANSHKQAQEAVEYHMYESESPVFSFENIEVGKEVDLPRPQRMQKLAEGVAKSDIITIENELDAFFKKILYIHMPPPKYVRGMCIYVMNDVLQYLSSILSSEVEIENVYWMQEIEELPTFSEIQLFMKEELINLSYSLQEQKNPRFPQAITEAILFVQENLYSRLRVEMIASHVHLSESHFSALFKKYMNISIREYILQRRIEKAKELLVEGNLTIFEIGEKLDYSDYRSFSRTFKRITGYTPTEYQKSIIENP